ncbi:MAG: hypothetical protein S0880_25500 [Actinomycetota bacterium]|nr:hypothetical protein [Actinomycetota bacterium]
MYKRVRTMTLVPAVAVAAVLAGCSTVGDLGGEVGSPPAVETTDSVPASTTSLPDGADETDGGLPLPEDTTTTVPTDTTAVPTDTTAPTPTTAAPTDTTAPPADPAAAAEVLAAAETVFDLSVPWATKAPLIEDSADLEATHTTVVQVANGIGTVDFAFDDVVVNGTNATFTFDVSLNGAPIATDLPGEANQVNGTWQITRASFCNALSQTAVACPA